jgi:hypothetical protein
MMNEKLLSEALKAHEHLRKKVKQSNRENQFKVDVQQKQAEAVATALDTNEKRQILEDIEGLISEVREAGLETALNRVVPKVKKISDDDRKKSVTQSRKVRDTLEELLFQEDVRKAKDEARAKGTTLGPITEGSRFRGAPDRFIPGVTGEVIKKDGDLVDAKSGLPIALGRETILDEKERLIRDIRKLRPSYNPGSSGVQAIRDRLTVEKAKKASPTSSSSSSSSASSSASSSSSSTFSGLEGLFDTVVGDTGKKAVKKVKKGSGLRGGCGATHTRLQVLVGSMEAGNKSKALSKQVMEMSDELLIDGKISKSQHKQIYDRYVK